MIEPELINRIVYAKYLYWQGNENLNKNTLLSDGIALLNFQDAVEIFLRAIAELIHASIKEQASFDVIINEIDNSEYISKDYKIPFRSSLNQLNKARVNFKHFGLLPQNKDVQKFSRDLELLFRELIPKFFKLSFDSISLINLVRHGRINNYLKASENELLLNNYEDSIIASAKAFKLLFGHRRNLDFKIGHFCNIGSQESIKALNKIKEILAEHELEIDILKYGFDYSEYSLFKSITPTIHLSAINTFISVHRSLNNECTLENAQFCLRFVIDSALRLQSLPKISNGYSRAKTAYQVINDSDIIVYPSSQDVEIIRKAQKDEVLYGHPFYSQKDDYCAIVQDDECAYILKKDIIQLEN
ncbi:MAG: hypothetical protein HGB15_04690 [Chlorobaculum sp.]|nr:hypothetical protein [Chlorobaculum sp.]